MTDVVAALIWEGDKFLACQRPANKARGLLWEFVGGKVEPGESKKDALIRECREELDVVVGVGDVFMEVIHAYPDLTVRLTLFNAWITEGVPKLLEHNDIRWITTKQIGDFSFCPADEDILKKLKLVENRLQAELMALGEPEYKIFQTGLMPTVNERTVLGVRMPHLRKIAVELRKTGEADAFVQTLPHRYYEENCIHGILISAMKDPGETVSALNAFLPYVDNWAVCDCISPKVFAERPQCLLPAVRAWLNSGHTYTARYAIGVLMKFYLDDGFCEEYLKLVSHVVSDEYYVRMMQAWYFATALAKQYDAALPYLEGRCLHPWTHSKTIQKAIESYRISPEKKAYLRTLKVIPERKR